MKLTRIAVTIALALAATACSDSDDQTSTIEENPISNAAPIAEAGADQSVIEGVLVTLDGSASTDSDGALTSSQWVQTVGPAAQIEDPTSLSTAFLAPDVNQTTDLTFELTVTDDANATATDMVTISIVPDPVDDATIVNLTFDGKDRSYTLYTPANFTPGNAAYVYLHQGNENMRIVLEPDRTTRRWVELADRDGALLIVPNGFNDAVNSGIGDEVGWNDLRERIAGVTSSEDDVGFILSVLADVAAQTAYDSARVYVSGASNGGAMTMRLLIDEPTYFAAGAAFVTALPEAVVASPAASTPIMMLNGTEDPIIAFNGDPIGAFGSPTRSVQATVDYWIQSTGADPNSGAFTTLTDTDESDNCTISSTTYSPLAADTNVLVYYQADGGGHTVPNPTPSAQATQEQATFGNICRDVHGVDLAVEFFQSLAP